MRIWTTGSACTALAVLWVSSPALATETTATVDVGGAKSCSSEGTSDPGLLSDNLTEASATYALTLDDVAATLTVVVTNTSPVLVGVPNPVLEDIYFNAPIAVTGMTLVSQTETAGATPAFVDTFDADLFTAPNPNGANGFGAFSMNLSDPGGIAGSIANAAADTLPGPPNSMAIGPVTFVFSLTGGLGGVTADDFANAFSTIPPGNKPVNAVGHFQGGGVAGASAFISNGPEACFLILSGTEGDGLFLAPDPDHHLFNTQLAEVGRCFGILLSSPVQIPLEPVMGRAVAMPRRGIWGAVPTLIRQFNVQTLLWNPEQFPSNPEQWSNGLIVSIWSDGNITSTPYGDWNGMNVTAEVVKTPDGRPYLTFPFTIDGL